MGCYQTLIPYISAGNCKSELIFGMMAYFRTFYKNMTSYPIISNKIYFYDVITLGLYSVRLKIFNSFMDFSEGQNRWRQLSSILSSSSVEKETEVKLGRPLPVQLCVLSARPSSPLSNSFFICSLGVCFLPFSALQYASNVPRFPEVFFKCSNALFASVKAGSEITESRLLRGSERRKRFAMAALRWISLMNFCKLTVYHFLPRRRAKSLHKNIQFFF